MDNDESREYLGLLLRTTGNAIKNIVGLFFNKRPNMAEQNELRKDVQDFKATYNQEKKEAYQNAKGMSEQMQAECMREALKNHQMGEAAGIKQAHDEMKQQ